MARDSMATAGDDQFAGQWLVTRVLRSRAKLRALAMAMIAAPILALPALAQETVTVTEPPTEDPGHLFGNWNGFRPLLKQYGITYDVDYYAEAATVAAGGRGSGSGYGDQRAVKIDYDWGAKAGVPGLATHVLFLNRAGNGVSPKASGDGLYPSIEIAGGGGNVAVHLAYLYFDETLANGALRVAAGRLQPGGTFGSSAIYCDFANLAFCGQPRPLPGSNPAFTNGTASNYGGFIIGRPLPTFYVEGGVFEASPHRGGRDGFDWSTSRATGALFPFELGFEPGGGAGQMPGHYKVGFYYDTSKRNDFYYDVNGNPLVKTGLSPRQDSGQVAVWVEADQMLVRHGPGAVQGLVAFAGYAHTDGNVGNYQDEAFIGIDDHGMFPKRPADGFGAMVTYGQQSSALAKTEALEIALGQTLEYGVAKHEIVLEAEYTAHVYNGIDIGPDIQYIIRPGASSKYSNALILGLQANISF